MGETHVGGLLYSYCIETHWRTLCVKRSDFTHAADLEDSLAGGCKQQRTE